MEDSSDDSDPLLPGLKEAHGSNTASNQTKDSSSGLITSDANASGEYTGTPVPSVRVYVRADNYQRVKLEDECDTDALCDGAPVPIHDNESPLSGDKNGDGNPRSCLPRSFSSPPLAGGYKTSESEESVTTSTSSSTSSSAFSLFATSRREKLILVSMASVELSSYMCLSIMAPFFPDEAAKQGISDTVSGWIFGIFALTQFVVSPCFGKLMPVVGARYMFLAGQFFAGGCVVLFGMLEYVDATESGKTTYLAMAFTLRIFLAIGCSASNTASFAITANTFPDNVSTVFGLLETATGLGMMIGPALGGVLYEFGGFMLPFAFLGAFMLLNVPINVLILPRQEDERRCKAQSSSLFAILRIPAISVMCVAVVMAATIWSILDPTLEPHLSVFNLSPSMVGLVFLLMSAFYAVSSPVWGWVADRVPDSTPLLIVGFMFSALGLLLLGPSPIFGLGEDYNELWLNVVALIILGVTSSLALVPTFEKILDSVEKAGIDDNFAMYGIVAGLWGGCYALGDFIGPTVGGWGLDNLGFPMCMTYTAAACTVTALILFVLWLWELKFGRTCVKSEEAYEDEDAVTERSSLLGSHRSTPRASLSRSLSLHDPTLSSLDAISHPSTTGRRNSSLARRVERNRIHRNMIGDLETTSIRSYNSTMTV